MDEEWLAAANHGVDLAASYFYCDSYNDLPMLERVGTAVAINPDARLQVVTPAAAAGRFRAGPEPRQAPV